MTGRTASSPADGQRPSHGLADLIFEHVDVRNGQKRMFDFASFSVSNQLKAHFFEAFMSAAGAMGTMKRRETLAKSYRVLNRFASILSSQIATPTSTHDLRPSHLTEARLGLSVIEFSNLKRILRPSGAEYTPEFYRALLVRSAPRPTAAGKTSYSEAELRRIMNAARTDIRAARSRIRANGALLEKWRGGEIDRVLESANFRRGQCLDMLAREAEIPRNKKQPGRQNSPAPVAYAALRKAGFSNGREAFEALFLSPQEALAFAVLLVGLTGVNVGTIVETSSAHHRADSGTGEDHAIAIVDLLKPRRGKYKARSTKSFTDIPSWAAESESEDGMQLLSPFGVYVLLIELGSWARALSDSDRLFVFYSTTGRRGRGVRFGLPGDSAAVWSRPHRLTADNGAVLSVTFPLMRLTFVELHDEPVVHTRTTLNDTYQVRNRGELRRNQKLVAQVLEDQVTAAQGTTLLAFLTEEDVAAARSDPLRAAKKYGVSRPILERVLDGALDTVLAACSDNENGPHNPGRPCQASFLMCAGCPCAISMPPHWPVQIAAHDSLLAKREEISEMRWAEVYGEPWMRLSDILRQMPAGAVDLARDRISTSDRELVERMLNRELDY